jgi:hypothetical protein
MSLYTLCRCNRDVMPPLFRPAQGAGRRVAGLIARMPDGPRNAVSRFGRADRMRASLY